MNRLNFASGFKRTRKASGLSKQDVADALNVSKQTIGKWEDGESTPDNPKYLKQLIALFDTDIYKLIGY